MTNSEEPNLVIYNLIKEIDYLIENSNFCLAQQNLNGGDSGNASSGNFKSIIAPGLLADY